MLPEAIVVSITVMSMAYSGKLQGSRLVGLQVRTSAKVSKKQI